MKQSTINKIQESINELNSSKDPIVKKTIKKLKKALKNEIKSKK